MPVEIDVKIDDREISDLLEGIRNRIKNLKPAMSIIGEIIQTSIQRNFEAGGRPRKWKRLKKTTREQRKRVGKWPGQTLVRSGLMSKISYQASSGQVVLSAGSKYAATHQFGAERGSFGAVTANIKAHMRRLKSGKKSKVRAHTKRMTLPWGNIPARPFMMVQKADWPEIRDALHRYIAGIR